MTDIFVQKRELKEPPRKVYVSADPVHGRLYYLLLKEMYASRLPYEFIYSPRLEGPGKNAAPDKMRLLIESAVREADAMLVICGCEGNRIQKECLFLGMANWQNFELHLARKLDIPVVVDFPQRAKEQLDEMKHAIYLEMSGFSREALGETLKNCLFHVTPGRGYNNG